MFLLRAFVKLSFILFLCRRFSESSDKGWFRSLFVHKVDARKDAHSNLLSKKETSNLYKIQCRPTPFYLHKSKGLVSLSVGLQKAKDKCLRYTYITLLWHGSCICLKSEINHLNGRPYDLKENWKQHERWKWGSSATAYAYTKHWQQQVILRLDDVSCL